MKDKGEYQEGKTTVRYDISEADMSLRIMFKLGLGMGRVIGLAEGLALAKKRQQSNG